jgi:hypothetical protein
VTSHRTLPLRAVLNSLSLPFILEPERLPYSSDSLSRPLHDAVSLRTSNCRVRTTVAGICGTRRRRPAATDRRRGFGFGPSCSAAAAAAAAGIHPRLHRRCGLSSSPAAATTTIPTTRRVLQTLPIPTRAANGSDPDPEPEPKPVRAGIAERPEGEPLEHDRCVRSTRGGGAGRRGAAAEGGRVDRALRGGRGGED